MNGYDVYAGLLVREFQYGFPDMPILCSREILWDEIRVCALYVIVWLDKARAKERSLRIESGGRRAVNQVLSPLQ
jgi:hypothetical protein